MKITVKRDELLAELVGNRKVHIAEYKEAMEGYRLAVTEHVAVMMLDANRHEDVNFNKHLPKPENYSKDYDRAIKMFSMSVDENINLEENEFDEYVMNKWNWHNKSTTTNSMYLNR